MINSSLEGVPTNASHSDHLPHLISSIHLKTPTHTSKEALFESHHVKLLQPPSTKPLRGRAQRPRFSRAIDRVQAPSFHADTLMARIARTWMDNPSPPVWVGSPTLPIKWR